MIDWRSRGPMLSRLACVTRRVGVVVAGCALFVTLFVATLAWQVSCSLHDPSSLTQALASPAVIDHAYDVVLPAVWRDRVGTVVRLESHDVVLRLPEQTPVVARDIVEAVWPRDVARGQIVELVAATASPIVGGPASSPIRFGPEASGWSELPRALSTAFDELAMGEALVVQLVAPIVRSRSEEVLGPLLGVSLSDAESRADSLRILPPVWIRAQLVTVTHAMVPYVSGTKSDFAAVIELRSRVPIAVEVLQEQIVEEHSTRDLVLDRVVDPLIEDRLASAGPLPLGIELSSAEIRETLLASIPPGWFARKTWVVLQAFSSYVTGESDGITFTIPLAERHAAFAKLLIELLRSKLAQSLDGLPVCAGRQLFGAMRALRTGRRPLCLPGGKNVLLDLAGPRIESEMARVVERLPTQLVMRHEDVSARVGLTRMAAIDRMRALVAEGVVWTNEDLDRLLDGAQPTFAALRRAEVSPPDIRVLATRTADEPVRRWLALGFTVVRRAWLLEIAALVWLGIIAALVTGSVARRLRWAASASTLAALGAAAVLVASSWPTPQHVSAWAMLLGSSWPSVTEALASGPLPVAISEWARELRAAAALALLPWMLLDPVARIVNASSSRRMMDR